MLYIYIYMYLYVFYTYAYIYIYILTPSKGVFGVGGRSNFTGEAAVTGQLLHKRGASDRVPKMFAFLKCGFRRHRSGARLSEVPFGVMLEKAYRVKVDGDTLFRCKVGDKTNMGPAQAPTP